MNNLEIIKAAVAKANTSKRFITFTKSDIGSTQDFLIEDKTIRLANVLLALEDKWRTMYTASYDFGPGKNRLAEGALLYNIVSSWELTKDSLEEQLPEVHEFLANLLKNHE